MNTRPSTTPEPSQDCPHIVRWNLPHLLVAILLGCGTIGAFVALSAIHRQITPRTDAVSVRVEASTSIQPQVPAPQKKPTPPREPPTLDIVDIQASAPALPMAPKVPAQPIAPSAHTPPLTLPSQHSLISAHRIQSLHSLSAATSTSSAPVTTGIGVGDGPVDGESLDSSIQWLHQPQPNYPLTMRRKGIQARFTVRYIIGTDGTIEHLEFLSPKPSPAFISATRDAILQWRCIPPLVNGEKRRVRISQEIIFATTH